MNNGSEFRLYMTDRDLPLIYVGQPRTRPVLAMENYCKWYGPYLVMPDGSVKKAGDEFWDALRVYEDSINHVSGDHVWNPIFVARIVADLGWMMCERSLEVLTGRWVAEARCDAWLDNSWPGVDTA